MTEYLLAVRRFVDAVELVANSAPAVGLPADVLDGHGWTIALIAERTAAEALDAGRAAWSAA